MTAREVTALARKVYRATGFRAVQMDGAPLTIRCQVQSRDEDMHWGMVAWGMTWDEVAAQIRGGR